MNAYDLMLKLGLALAGTNADLSFVAPPSDEGEGDDTDDTDESDESDEDGEGSDDGDMDGEGDGEPSDAKSGKGKQGKSSTKGEPSEQGEQGGKGSGGGSTVRDDKTFDAQAFAQSLLAAMERGDEAGVKDLANALAEAIGAEKKAQDGTVEANEALWNPYTTSNDKVVVVSAGPDARDAGRKLQESVRREVSFLLSLIHI